MATQTGTTQNGPTVTVNASHITQANPTNAASTNGCPLQQNNNNSLTITPNTANIESSFDPYDEESWFFGYMGRAEATELLLQEPDLGVFIVRESTTVHGDLVLSVKESVDKVSHYIINKIAVKKDPSKAQIWFKIGDQSFLDVPSLLMFYKLHLLDTTSLTRPAKVKDKKSNIIIDYLETLSSNNNNNNMNNSSPFSSSQDDQVPPHSQATNNKSHIATDNQLINRLRSSIQDSTNQSLFSHSNFHRHFEHSSSQQSNSLTGSQSSCGSPGSKRNQNLPRLARVIQSRVPNAYDKTALTLKFGDIIKVTETHMSGQWEGELNGKKGHFPFTHVEFIEATDGHEDIF